VTASAPLTRQPTKPPRSTARDPRSVELGYRSPTEYGALSSDGATIYTVRLIHGVWTCQCAGYRARQTCCHALAAGLDRCFWCGATERVTTYINRNDNGAELALCAACFSPKAAQS